MPRFTSSVVITLTALLFSGQAAVAGLLRLNLPALHGSLTPQSPRAAVTIDVTDRIESVTEAVLRVRGTAEVSGNPEAVGFGMLTLAVAASNMSPYLHTFLPRPLDPDAPDEAQISEFDISFILRGFNTYCLVTNSSGAYECPRVDIFQGAGQITVGYFDWQMNAPTSAAELLPLSGTTLYQDADAVPIDTPLPLATGALRPVGRDPAFRIDDVTLELHGRLIPEPTTGALAMLLAVGFCLRRERR